MEAVALLKPVTPLATRLPPLIDQPEPRTHPEDVSNVPFGINSTPFPVFVATGL